MTNLELKIKDAAQRYYSDGSSPYTDEQFDKMVEQLKYENPNSELLRGIGFGYDVNKDSTPGKRYEHKYTTIGGLDKAYNWDEIPKNFKHKVIYASAKLDGLSVVLYYKEGRLDQALTRGRDNRGIDITNKVIAIIGDTIQDKWFSGGVRGEIIMTEKNFEKFLEIHKDEIDDDKIKNSRNCSAGLINAKELSNDLSLLNIVVYSITGIYRNSATAISFPNNYIDSITFEHWDKFLNSSFEYVAPFHKICLTEENYNEQLISLKDKFTESYPVDGVVLTSGIVYQQHNSYMDPMSEVIEVKYSQIAFKFKSETAQSKVIDVEWNYTKSRYLMPKVNIETIQLAGTNVSFCTGYNAQYMKENNIGIGSIVEVEKRGEIIPNINKVIESTECNLPETCPHCNSKLVWSGVHLQCPNKNCDGAEYEDLMCWLRNIAPVDGLGDTLRYKLISSLYSNSLLKVPVTIDKVMNDITRYKEIVICGGRQTGHKKLLIEMLTKLSDDSKISLVSAIKALNIPRFGDVNSEKLAQYPELVKNLLSFSLGNYSSPNIRYESMRLIGEANTAAIYDNLNKFKRLKLIIDRIDWNTETKNNVEFKGTVCVTGKLSVKRNDFEQELNASGYKLGELTKSTIMLITDNPNSNSSKNQKADKLGIHKITESEFRNKYLNINNPTILGVDLAHSSDFTSFGG